MADISFEEAIKKLEKIVMGLETGEVNLESSLAKYEEGIALARICQKKLETAKKKVEILIKSKDGTISMEPFEPEEYEKKRPKKKQDEKDSLF